MRRQLYPVLCVHVALRWLLAAGIGDIPRRYFMEQMQRNKTTEKLEKIQEDGWDCATSGLYTVL